MFRAADKNVARKENQEECVAPTTARSPGRPPGCALMVASDKRSSFATNLMVGQTFMSDPNLLFCGQVGMPVLLRWPCAQMQRRNSASQILITDFGKASRLHHCRQCFLIRKARNRVRQIFVGALRTAYPTAKQR